MRAVLLDTPPLPCLVPSETFDAFGWCASTVLEWRAPGPGLVLNAMNDALPLGLAFVFREPFAPLPAEFARLHTGRAQAAALGLTDARCLAPYAIDDATDELYAHRRPPGATFWLAADNANALYWALHDWSHFHNHGSFDDRPSTELQCDLAALCWLWRNLGVIPLPADHWEHLRAAAALNHHALRAQHPDTRCPPRSLLDEAPALQRFAEALQRTP